ncbi:hypothetical protein MOE86_15420 [Bacillus atrophaeus]|uniref:hypothetical protein n=1 Tax=Bacillus atrophaeus TaxID=1452 RepID=UPI00228270BD|nr:hypothetical protein [Bacillus atrophaeus]MCY9198067.1 hypothetical protein [Bacillus atrophaeus]
MNKTTGAPRQERIFASKLCKASKVSQVCKKAKGLFITGDADDFVIANALMLQLGGPKSVRYLEMEVDNLGINQQDTD